MGHAQFQCCIQLWDMVPAVVDYRQEWTVKNIQCRKP